MAQLELRRRRFDANRLIAENAELTARLGATDRDRKGGIPVDTAPWAGTQRHSDAGQKHEDKRARLALLSLLEDQQQIEARLRQSETHYRHLFEHNPAPMLVYARSDLRLLAINEAFTAHYGYSHAEALKLRLTDLYPERERQPVTDLAASLSGLAFVGEWHHLQKDGGQIAIEVHGA